jgi:hypothetical protein
MSGIFTVFIFFAIIALTAVIFFGWVVFLIGRAVIGGIASLFMPSRPRGLHGGPMMSHTVQCPTRMCGAINPTSARFCRRCGRGLPAAQRVQVRRAAVW